MLDKVKPALSPRDSCSIRNNEGLVLVHTDCDAVDIQHQSPQRDSTSFKLWLYTPQVERHTVYKFCRGPKSAKCLATESLRCAALSSLAQQSGQAVSLQTLSGLAKWNTRNRSSPVVTWTRQEIVHECFFAEIVSKDGLDPTAQPALWQARDLQNALEKSGIPCPVCLKIDSNDKITR